LLARKKSGRYLILHNFRRENARAHFDDAEPTARAPRSGSRARVAGFASSDTVPSAAMVSAALAVLSAAHWAFSLALVLVGLLASWLRSGRRVERSVGFFHPFTSDGGGGERVLWCAVREVQSADRAVETVVYTGDDLSGVELARRAADRFGVVLPRPIAVVRLATRHLTRPERYPAFTMLGQAFGSAVCTAEALSLYRPDVFFDTTGHAFGYPLARLAGCRVAAYVHYPAVSTDMIRRVRTPREAFNNDARVARSALKSTAKLVYYNLFAIIYGLCGKCASVAVCNSSWTQAHVRALWGGEPARGVPALRRRRAAGGAGGEARVGGEVRPVRRAVPAGEGPRDAAARVGGDEEACGRGRRGDGGDDGERRFLERRLEASRNGGLDEENANRRRRRRPGGASLCYASSAGVAAPRTRRDSRLCARSPRS